MQRGRLRTRFGRPLEYANRFFLDLLDPYLVSTILCYGVSASQSIIRNPFSRRRFLNLDVDPHNIHLLALATVIICLFRLE